MIGWQKSHHGHSQWRIQNSTWEGGGTFSRPEGPSGEGTGGVSPPVGGGIKKNDEK